MKGLHAAFIMWLNSCDKFIRQLLLFGDVATWCLGKKERPRVAHSLFRSDPRALENRSKGSVLMYIPRKAECGRTMTDLTSPRVTCDLPMIVGQAGVIARNLQRESPRVMKSARMKQMRHAACMGKLEMRTFSSQIFNGIFALDILAFKVAH